MSLFEIILINTIFILFPLILCLLYQTYNKVCDRDKNNLFLDCALCSSFYFIVRFGLQETSFLSSLILNIPLVVAYMRKRLFSITILSLCSILYYHQEFDISYFWLFLEYGFYALLYYLSEKEVLKSSHFLDSLTAFKMIFFCIANLFYNFFAVHNLGQLFITYFLLTGFYILTKFLLYLFNKTEEILELHQQIKDFDEEKQIRDSLFKITHEIKNPIAVCKGYLDMFDVNNTEHSRKFVPILKDEIARVLILLQDFLSITKIKIDKDIIDFNVLVEDTISSFDLLLKEKGITCVSHVSEEEWYLNADYNRLSQVLINIIKNSIEAIPEDQQGEIKITTQLKKSNMEVVIEDNGSGISKEHMKQMKEPFFTTKPKGTGLGVYLSLEIVKGHDGTMRYFSKEGEGTKVVLSFPYVKEIY